MFIPKNAERFISFKKSNICLLFGSIWGCYKLIHWIIKNNHIPGQYHEYPHCFDDPMPLNLGTVNGHIIDWSISLNYNIYIYMFHHKILGKK